MVTVYRPDPDLGTAISQGEKVNDQEVCELVREGNHARKSISIFITVTKAGRRQCRWTMPANSMPCVSPSVAMSRRRPNGGVFELNRSRRSERIEKLSPRSPPDCTSTRGEVLDVLHQLVEGDNILVVIEAAMAAARSSRPARRRTWRRWSAAHGAIFEARAGAAGAGTKEGDSGGRVVC